MNGARFVKSLYGGGKLWAVRGNGGRVGGYRHSHVTTNTNADMIPKRPLKTYAWAAFSDGGAASWRPLAVVAGEDHEGALREAGWVWGDVCD